MDIGAPVVDSLLGLGLGLGGLRLGQLRPEIVRVDGLHRGLRAAAKERSQAQSAQEQSQKALHRRDATLPRLLATPIVPHPEAAHRRRGRFSP